MNEFSTDAATPSADSRRALPFTQFSDTYPSSHFPGLRAKLSQAFTTYTVVFLVISAYRVFRTRDSVETFAVQANQALTSDCDAIEKTVQTLASFPRFAAQGVNRGLVLALDNAISQIGYGLEVILSGILATLELVIGLLTGTWRCFLLNLAQSGIPLLSEVGEGGVQAIDEMDNAFIALLATPVYDLQRIVQETMADPQSGLVLNVPTLSIQKATFCSEAVDLIAVDTLSADFKRWILYATVALLSVAVVATLFNIVWITFRHRRWMTHVGRVMDQLVTMSSIAARLSTLEHGEDGITTGISSSSSTFPQPRNEGIKEMDPKLYAQHICYMTRHPMLYRIVNWCSYRLYPNNEHRRDLYFWFIFYISHPPAVVCLVIGLLGLALVYSQIALIDFTKAHYQPTLKTLVINLSQTIFRLVNDMMATASVAFANETNAGVISLETDLNANVFGVISRAAGEANAALANVQTTLVSGIQSVFGDTPFGKVVLAVLQCLLLNKLVMVETGLTWVQQNAHIALPRVSDDVLMLDPAEMNRLVSEAVYNVVQAPPEMSGPKDDRVYSQSKAMQVKKAIDSIFEGYKEVLRRELPVYYGLIGVWWVVVAMGVAGVGAMLCATSRNSAQRATCRARSRQDCQI
ncbi:plasma membrane fusion protein prm1 [Dissophora globulifera]|uniref:Plasma membrane fusion protein PRM1 n=1 Tax=Dissophora globulifera TaxID=979702 RepID=A0A9P6RIB3_9FUNG|nr:plasma membrane fusion protein prm1 [Dissophora globulifera]